MTAVDVDHLRAWIGRREERTDVLSLSHAGRMAALLDRPRPSNGDELPPLWHWIYFAPDASQSDIGPDGHPKLGGFLPPIPLPRRMWAGGRLRFHARLRIGEAVRRVSEIVAIEVKSGRQGELVFLTVRHNIANAAGQAIEEEQDLVYRAHSTTARPSAATGEPNRADWRDGRAPDAVLLFRYSALTFNAHRIHYDLPYATEAEGYPGLVVQGPLIATLLMEAFVRHTGSSPRDFAFRGQAPLFADSPMNACGRKEEAGGHAIWAEGAGDYVAMTATLSTAT